MRTAIQRQGRQLTGPKALPGPRRRWPTCPCLDSVETDRPVPLGRQRGKAPKGKLSLRRFSWPAGLNESDVAAQTLDPELIHFSPRPCPPPLRGFQCEDHMTRATDLFPLTPPFAHSFPYRRILLLQQAPSTPSCILPSSAHPSPQPSPHPPPVRTMFEGQGQMQRRPYPIFICNP